MKKWEYRDFAESIDFANEIPFLNNLGKEGWELVETARLKFDDLINVRFRMKREIPEQTAPPAEDLEIKTRWQNARKILDNVQLNEVERVTLGMDVLSGHVTMPGDELWQSMSKDRQAQHVDLLRRAGLLPAEQLDISKLGLTSEQLDSCGQFCPFGCGKIPGVLRVHLETHTE